MQHPMLTIAIRAARAAGNTITKHYEMLNTINRWQKDHINLSININKLAETVIIKIIHKSYIKHSIISEENSDYTDSSQDTQWIINSLNGKSNFLKSLPHFCVSVAVQIKKRNEVAVVYDPMRNELFTAVRGQGAQLNGYRLRASTICDLNNAILASSSAFSIKKYLGTYMHIFKKLFIECNCADFRCTGSIALDLAYVASGRLDGFFDINLHLWDFAAGELIAREAGALVCDFTGGHNYMITGNLIAANPRIVKAILTNIHDSINNMYIN